MKNPYSIIKSELITEKSTMLAGLEGSESNSCTKRCKTPKRVFIVDKRANKIEVTEAIEELHRKENIKVLKVNTINMKPKRKQMRGRKGRIGHTAAFKKAIVTFSENDSEVLRNL